VPRGIKQKIPVGCRSDTRRRINAINAVLKVDILIFLMYFM
jgi:hypothetical protein